MQAMDSVATWVASLGVIAAFYICGFFSKRWNALLRAKWQFGMNEVTLPVLISLAQLKISRSPSTSVTMLEEEVVVAEVTCELPCPPQHQAYITRSVCHQRG